MHVNDADWTSAQPAPQVTKCVATVPRGLRTLDGPYVGGKMQIGKEISFNRLQSYEWGVVETSGTGRVSGFEVVSFHFDGLPSLFVYFFFLGGGGGLGLVGKRKTAMGNWTCKLRSAFYRFSFKIVSRRYMTLYGQHGRKKKHQSTILIFVSFSFPFTMLFACSCFIGYPASWTGMMFETKFQFFYKSFQNLDDKKMRRYSLAHFLTWSVCIS